MSTRIITGNLTVEPEAVQAGRVQIVKLRVFENTGEYRAGEWTPHEAPTTHFVEAKHRGAARGGSRCRRGHGIRRRRAGRRVRARAYRCRDRARLAHRDRPGVQVRKDRPRRSRVGAVARGRRRRARAASGRTNPAI